MSVAMSPWISTVAPSPTSTAVATPCLSESSGTLDSIPLDRLTESDDDFVKAEEYPDFSAILACLLKELLTPIKDWIEQDLTSAKELFVLAQSQHLSHSFSIDRLSIREVLALEKLAKKKHKKTRKRLSKLESGILWPFVGFACLGKRTEFLHLCDKVNRLEDLLYEIVEWKQILIHQKKKEKKRRVQGLVRKVDLGLNNFWGIEGTGPNSNDQITFRSIDNERMNTPILNGIFSPMGSVNKRGTARTPQAPKRSFNQMVTELQRSGDLSMLENKAPTISLT